MIAFYGRVIKEGENKGLSIYCKWTKTRTGALNMISESVHTQTYMKNFRNNMTFAMMLLMRSIKSSFP